MEDVIEKLIVKHNVQQIEVIEVLSNLPLFRRIEKGQRKDEDLYAALGRTDSGRYLTVFFIYKKAKQALNISARDMTRVERKKYEKR